VSAIGFGVTSERDGVGYSYLFAWRHSFRAGVIAPPLECSAIDAESARVGACRVLPVASGFTLGKAAIIGIHKNPAIDVMSGVLR